MTALPVDLRALQRRVAEGEPFEFLYFWGHTPRAGDGVGRECLSQWYPAAFDVDGVRHASAEHFMMGEKARLFSDDEALQRIRRAGTPAEAKEIGRTVRGFDEARWVAHRFDAVVAGNVAKFGQNPPLAAYLRSTGDAILVEASPRDRIWGIGMGAESAARAGPAGWRGLNLLGFALVETRARLARAG